MLDINFIRENTMLVKKAAKDKGVDVDIPALLKLDKERRKYISNRDELRAKQNIVTDEIAKEKNKDERANKIGEMQHLKKDLKDVESHITKIEVAYDALMRKVPNIPYKEVPIGKGEEDNKVLYEVGKRPSFSFNPVEYLSLAKRHDWIDIERASKVSGSRFGYIKGDLALLEFALIQYTLAKLTAAGFIAVVPPVLIKPEYMDAMGFLQGEMKDDIYFLEKDQMYLVGTSEQAIGPMHAGEVLDYDSLPLRYAGFSTCFRREAGSYGKDTKGILRVHQFDKVEMISFTTPENSRKEHKFMLDLNEEMIQELGLPYRVVHISTGDLGLSKAEQFDIETWIPSENKYRETHSASNTTDFQSRRLEIRTKTKEGEAVYVHMLNDTAFAIGRTLIALIENHQQKDGSVAIPKVLQKYYYKKIIGK